MNNAESVNITIVADNEEKMYQQFSPEDEFSDAMKAYIRSKMASADYRQHIDITVKAREPINEERFRAAVSNWTRDEKKIFRRKKKDMIGTLAMHLILGSVLIIVSLALEKHFTLMKYSLIPILASFALGKAAGILIKELPENGITKAVINTMEHNSMITFEYGGGQSPEDGRKPDTEEGGDQQNV